MSAFRNHIRAAVPAMRTLEAIRPTTQSQVILAGLFSGELMLKFAQILWKWQSLHTLYYI